MLNELLSLFEIPYTFHRYHRNHRRDQLYCTLPEIPECCIELRECTELYSFFHDNAEAARYFLYFDAADRGDVVAVVVDDVGVVGDDDDDDAWDCNS